MVVALASKLLMTQRTGDERDSLQTVKAIADSHCPFGSLNSNVAQLRFTKENANALETKNDLYFAHLILHSCRKVRLYEIEIHESSPS